MLQIHSQPDGPTVLLDVGGPTPVAAIYVWFPFGAADETDDLAGAAHLLEHMLFKGAGGHGPGHHVRQIEALGGEINAFTAHEQLVLHATAPSDRAQAVLSILLEMAFRPHLDAGELTRERQVVLEELREAEDNPEYLLSQALRRRLWGPHPYGRAILGTAASVEGLTAAALRAAHARWLSPGAALISIAGPIDPEPMLAFIRGAVSPRAAPTRPDRPAQAIEPGALGVDAGFDEHVLELVFPIPGPVHPDAAAIDLLASALGDGPSAPLSERLRHRLDLVTGTWAALEVDRDGGLLAIGLTAREGRLLDAARALGGLLEEVRRGGLDARSLRRTRATIRADRLRETETVDGRAFRHAWYTAYHGDPEASRRMEAALMALRPYHVAAAARRYLDPERCVIGVMSSATTPEAVASALAAGRSAASSRATQRPPQSELSRFTMDNGLRVVVRPDPEAELVALSLVGVGGAIAEGHRNAGLAQAWQATLMRGAGDLDALGFADEIADRSGLLVPWTARNSFGVSASFPANELSTSLRLLGTLLAAPHFAEHEVARVRADLTEAWRVRDDDPERLAWDRAWATLFPGHAWGRPPSGTPTSIARITPGRLRGLHRRQICGSNLVLTITGGVQPGEASALVRRTLGGLAAGSPHPWQPGRPLGAARRRTIRVPRADAPAHLVLAFPCAGHGDPAAPATRLLSAVLGGASSGGGRIFERVREQRGLAYQAGAMVQLGLGGGMLACALATDRRTAASAERALWEALDEVTAGPVPDDELAGTRAGLVDGAVLGLQRSLSRAEHLAVAERHGPGAEQADAILRAPGGVSAAALLETARAVLRRDRAISVWAVPRTETPQA